MDSLVTAAPTLKPPPRASSLLLDLVDAFPNDRVTVGEVLDRLDGRAFGLLLLVLALPNCIPNIPGLSTIFGVMMLAPAIQMIFGRDDLWLPRSVKAWSFSRDSLRATIKGALPLLKRIEGFIGPRWTAFVSPPATQILGLQTLVMALVLMLPIPAGNWPPGMTVAATALALLQRDGRLALLSVPMAILSLAIAAVGVRLGYAALRELGDMLHNAMVFFF